MYAVVRQITTLAPLCTTLDARFPLPTMISGMHIDATVAAQAAFAGQVLRSRAISKRRSAKRTPAIALGMVRKGSGVCETNPNRKNEYTAQYDAKI
jgi:hypothetical protein